MTKLNPQRQKLVIVGNGMVSHRLCLRLVESGALQTYDVIVLGEEPRRAYDRVHLTDFFKTRSVDPLYLCDDDWYRDNNITLHTGTAVVSIDRETRVVHSSDGIARSYDRLVLATGSAPFVPRIENDDVEGVFVYRTIEDLEAIIEHASRASSAAVLGGGLLGLEAAKAALDLGLNTSVVELADRLMPTQLDAEGGAVLRRKIEELGIRVYPGERTAACLGETTLSGLLFASGEVLNTDMLIISAGIRPRDELARSAGLNVGERGGIVVDDTMATSDPNIYAVGEVASFDGRCFGLVAPCYAMVDVLVGQLAAGEDSRFSANTPPTALKLLGVEVGAFGDCFARGDHIDTIRFTDFRRGIYRRVNIDKSDDTLVGGILVGDNTQFLALSQMSALATPVPERAEALVVCGDGIGEAGMPDAVLPDHAVVCSCENITKGSICCAIRDQDLSTIGDVKSSTRAGSGCGGCVPMLTGLLKEEMRAAGREMSTHLCEHFAYSRVNLFEIAKVNRIKSFDELIAVWGTGTGCETCKPAVASIFASLWNDTAVIEPHIQDTNDRFLANIQRGGTYSVIPRVPAGELTPQQLIVLGEIAAEYDLYTKITGGQRVALFGARVELLPEIWEKLIVAGFESGHAYGKALRTVKSCVGTDWCRFGVGDSCGLAIDIEARYKGLRAPHKIKMAASGCIRECAEARSKDVGLIAVDDGWNLYVGGNGGSKPRHAELLASAIDRETAIRYIDRFLMYYIHTADKLTRTAAWIEQMEGGIEHLRQVVVHDSLGICARLEVDMQRTLDTYQCEWTQVVNDPELRRRFTHFENDSGGDASLSFIDVRGQRRPTPWEQYPEGAPEAATDTTTNEARWVDLGPTSQVKLHSGTTFRFGRAQIAVFHHGNGEWFASQNMCPHKMDMVLARGIVGDEGGEPTVACPMHKQRFSLKDGANLSGDLDSLMTFPVREESGRIELFIPQTEELEAFPQLTGACNGGECPSHSDTEAEEHELPTEAPSPLNLLAQITHDLIGPGRDFPPKFLKAMRRLHGVGLRRGTVALYNEVDDLLQVVGAHGMTAAQRRRGVYRRDEGVIGQVFTTGQHVVVDSIAESDTFLDRTASRGDEVDVSFICVPIFTSSRRVLGTLSADRLTSSSAGSVEDDVQLLTVIAGVMADVLLSWQRHASELSEKMGRPALRSDDGRGFTNLPGVVGCSSAMKQLALMVESVAPTDATVLLRGETGTGKELIARAIHRTSKRASQPFVAVNCGAIPPDLVESELFGYVRGAFTGADRNHSGRIRRADGGTLFLDEIGELPISAQVKLLRVIQEHEIAPIGASECVPVNIRVIAATHADLETRVEQGGFRGDLFYRINVFPVPVPPLRDRRADITTLVDHFVEYYAREHRRTVRRVSSQAIELLMSYDWPGNVRELENCVSRAVVLAEDGTIRSHHLPPSLQTGASSGTALDGTLDGLLGAYEREILIDAMKDAGGVVKRAAESLGSTQRVIAYRLKRHGLHSMMVRARSSAG